jgi:hypothetical protein
MSLGICIALRHVPSTTGFEPCLARPVDHSRGSTASVSEPANGMGFSDKYARAYCAANGWSADDRPTLLQPCYSVASGKWPFEATLATHKGAPGRANVAALVAIQPGQVVEPEADVTVVGA